MSKIVCRDYEFECIFETRNNDVKKVIDEFQKTPITKTLHWLFQRDHDTIYREKDKEKDVWHVNFNGMSLHYSNSFNAKIIWIYGSKTYCWNKKKLPTRKQKEGTISKNNTKIKEKELIIFPFPLPMLWWFVVILLWVFAVLQIAILGFLPFWLLFEVLLPLHPLL